VFRDVLCRLGFKSIFFGSIPTVALTSIGFTRFVFAASVAMICLILFDFDNFDTLQITPLFGFQKDNGFWALVSFFLYSCYLKTCFQVWDIFSRHKHIWGRKLSCCFRIFRKEEQLSLRYFEIIPKENICDNMRQQSFHVISMLCFKSVPSSLKLWPQSPWQQFRRSHATSRQLSLWCSLTNHSCDSSLASSVQQRSVMISINNLVTPSVFAAPNSQ